MACASGVMSDGSASIQRGTSCIQRWSIAATSEARGSRTRCCTSPGGVTRPTNSSRSSSITTSGLSSVGVGMPGSAMGRDRSSWSSSAGHATKKSWTPAERDPGGVVDAAQRPGHHSESLCRADWYAYAALGCDEIGRVTPSLLQ